MLRKVLTYTFLILGLLLDIAVFATANSYAQLGIATVGYLVLAFSFLLIYPRKHRKAAQLKQDDQKVPTLSLSPTTEEEPVEDADKRSFLHLIWSAGIAFFIYSIVNKRSELSFFTRAGAGSGITSIADADGNKINPAQEHAMQGYVISDIDEHDSDSVYYGYTREDGKWYISRQVLEDNTFRYSSGAVDYPSAWNSRKNLNYDYFFNIKL
ncbi:hypothetical protein C4561_04305 [candidate division WWE3 bacterium]|jgi:hypothetical protein|uniref:Uncharacterized protein n=1 Tax=candidate division WWE3 bacterium TaxID=2053526 RepID=A0A3A4ZCI8_UNCKA|nr:MAG: hypothetical protein C4561_04305 [candidate division WWE3 bacterium]